MSQTRGDDMTEDEIIRLVLNVLAQRYACLRNNAQARTLLETGAR